MKPIKTIFNYIMLPTILIIFISIISAVWITTISLETRLHETIKQDLVATLSRIKKTVHSKESLNQELSALKTHPHMGTTLISEKGDIQYDSKSAYIDYRNQLNEPEILNTQNSGIGTSIRYNPMTHSMAIFAAAKLNIGAKIIYIRINYPASTIQDLMISVIPKIAIQTALIILLGISIIIILARSITKELSILGETATQLSKGNFVKTEPQSNIVEFKQLFKHLNQTSTELEYTHKELLKDKEIRKNFVSNVSHELKTPITLIQGFVETLIDDPNLDAKTRQSYLKIMSTHTNRMTHIIEDLLTLAKIELEEEKAENIEFKESNIHDLLQRLKGYYQSKATEKNITLSISCEPDCYGVINAHFIEQALGNLIDNALNYTDNNTQITISAETKEDMLILSVSDQGKGIPIEHQDKIFNRFYRIEESRTRDNGGTGLGLAIAKHIAVLHHGSIAVESTEEKGSHFYIKIPIIPT